jgi:regulator of RNase E activity RraA
MIPWNNDAELFNLMAEKLYAPVISDALDAIGYHNQAMRCDIRPLYMEAVAVGRAMPVLCIDVYEIPSEPYQMEIEAVDSLKPNDVLVCTTNDSKRNCFWGELLSTAARTRGARGAVVEGFIRDTKKIIAMQFPVFMTGISPVDSKGRGDVLAYNVPIMCGGVRVNPGDIVFGDYDGVVVIPKAVEKEVIEAAFEKVSGENRTREELLKGSTLRAVYDKYGVL